MVKFLVSLGPSFQVTGFPIKYLIKKHGNLRVPKFQIFIFDFGLKLDEYDAKTVKWAKK